MLRGLLLHVCAATDLPFEEKVEAFAERVDALAKRVGISIISDPDRVHRKGETPLEVLASHAYFGCLWHALFLGAGQLC